MNIFHRTFAALAAAAALSACAPMAGTAPHRAGLPAPAPAVPAAPPAAAGDRYRCSDGSAFSVLQRDDGALRLAGLAGQADEALLRDAGGQTPQQAVYRNDRLRASFGLGADGSGVRIEIAVPPRTLDCTRG